MYNDNNWAYLQLLKLPGGLPHGFPGPIHIKVTLFGVIVISTDINKMYIDTHINGI